MKCSRFRLIVVLITASVFAGCATSRQPAPSVAVSTLAIWDRLYFGRDIPSGGQVTDADWTKFLAEVVTPRFPSGFTVIRGEGQWRGKSGEIAREQSFILDLNHSNDPAGDRLVEEIALEYKRRFAQEAVFRMRLPVDTRIL